MFNEIAKAFPKMQFTWIGDGELRSELTSSNITITGWLEHEEVLKELNKSDIFILPSLWEGLPISLLEAMYMKKICIVSNVIGNKDVIEDGRNGFIATDYNEYIYIIKKIRNKSFDNIVEKIRLISNQEIISNYNIKCNVTRYKNIYFCSIKK